MHTGLRDTVLNIHTLIFINCSSFLKPQLLLKNRLHRRSAQSSIIDREGGGGLRQKWEELKLAKLVEFLSSSSISSSSLHQCSHFNGLTCSEHPLEHQPPTSAAALFASFCCPLLLLPAWECLGVRELKDVGPFGASAAP